MLRHLIGHPDTIYVYVRDNDMFSARLATAKCFLSLPYTQLYSIITAIMVITHTPNAHFTKVTFYAESRPIHSSERIRGFLSSYSILVLLL